MGDMMLRWVKLSLVALVGCGFIGMVIYALWMRDEIRTAQVEPALISAPDTPLKRRPDEPGGMVVPNRDKIIFDLLDESSTGVSAPAPAPVAGTVEQLPLAGAATPTEVVTGTVAHSIGNSATLNIPPIKTAASQKAPAQPAAAPAAPAAQPAAQPVAQATPQPSEFTASAKTVPAAKPVSDVIVAAPAQPVPVQEAKPTPQPQVKAEAKAEPKSEAKPAKAEAKSGSWGVQLAAVGSKAEAQKMATTLQGKFAALKGLNVATPDAGNGHWRVQFVGLANRAAAAKVCSQLGGKQPCFPVSGTASK